MFRSSLQAMEGKYEGKDGTDGCQSTMSERQLVHWFEQVARNVLTILFCGFYGVRHRDLLRG